MDSLTKAADALRSAQHIMVITGAGISAGSGISTFRDRLTGLWERQDPQRLESAQAFRENPALVWGWYLWRRQQVMQAQPNAAHRAIHRLCGSGRSVTVVTQNVDDLHERAGNQDVLHLHGSLIYPKCFACHRYVAEPLVFPITPTEGALIEPPRCRRCNGRLRPGMVWFGEDLPPGAWKTASRAARQCDALLSIGISGVVRPAADLPDIALGSGAVVIHVNTIDVSMNGPNEIMLIGPAEKAVPNLIGLALSS
ncbi:MULTISPECIES: SIR2 family NAD-dependent protein deacylase [Pseudomonas]|uniref:NAD-dependent protein deacylase n=1 Tax=Pseudomonas putida TaxID=303 RepID=A0A7W2QM50_PSEPU|nr:MULTISPECIES: NAD-dependent protein deacylase [Pseudomonas]MBA6119319.1 NAD-dependent protein deacylase [Pseudomonas putida]PZQ37924.1 MAG: NAD-dependent protein deacylase [Pseudomonas putida]QIZ22628.1 NAD-dependent protein deacetylase of SIR2 family [Pseudomonas putida]UTL89088.1 NAD-dependent protein deacylase [Pseudomonas fluorescens]